MEYLILLHNMTLKESQTTMYQHSEVKVKLLQLYLERYLNILFNSRFVGDIYLYDLFCGEGIYENGGKGSPVIILESIAKTLNSNKDRDKGLTKFHCLFNDVDKTKIEKLNKIISKSGLITSDIGSVSLETKEYQEILPDVISKINSFKKEKAFVFIDPYGYKEIRMSDIHELLSHFNSEVLLFLPTQFMFRFEKKGTPESLKDFISEIIPQEEWPASETSIDFIENLKAGFRNALGNNFFVDSFIISRDKNQFFCLFFFTSHIYGFEKMLESKWSIDKEEGRGWVLDCGPDLFSSIDKKPNIDKFEVLLEEYIMESRKSNGMIYEFTVRNGHLPAHAKQILLKFQNHHRLIVESSDGKPPRKSSFYINYKDASNYPEKVMVKLKS